MLAIAANPPSMLPRAVTLLLIVGAGVMAAHLTLRVLAPDVRPAVTVDIPAPDRTRVAPVSSESPLARVAEIPLFGEPGVRTVPEPVVAPDTRLRLRLVGLVAGDTPDQGRAIIAESGSPERLYGIGDPVGSGQARLHQVHPDRVILDRDGTYETLRLPRADAATTEAPGATPTRLAPTTTTPAASDAPRVQRSEWLQDPERLMQSVRARPVIEDGVLRGLEVHPTRNARQFQQAGLRPGDVITAVNGMPVSAIEDTDRLFQELAGQMRVDIVVERGGQPLPISIQLVD